MGLVEGIVADKLGSPHDNVLTGTVRQVIRSRSESLPEVAFPHVSLEAVDDLADHYKNTADAKEKSTSYALVGYAGYPSSNYSGSLPMELILQPAELRAVMYDEPPQDWIDIIMDDLGPDKLLIPPRWRVMDEVWNVLWLDTPGDPWNTYLAVHDSTVELVETPVTGESGVEVHESVTWPSSTGVAGFLVFNPAFPAQLTPEWSNIHAPASYDLGGEQVYSGTNPWDLPLEDPAYYKGWEPGLP